MPFIPDEPDYCDDCGDPIATGEASIVTQLPVAVQSANEGESATLCRPCQRKVKKQSKAPRGQSVESPEKPSRRRVTPCHGHPHQVRRRAATGAPHHVLVAEFLNPAEAPEEQSDARGGFILHEGQQYRYAGTRVMDLDEPDPFQSAVEEARHFLHGAPHHEQGKRPSLAYRFVLVARPSECGPYLVVYEAPNGW